MGDPISASSVLFSALSGSIGAAGKAKQGAYSAAIDERNAAAADFAAQDAIQRGAQEGATIRGKGSKVIGAERAGYGASGVDVGVGSPADVQAETRAVSELDAKTAENNAARQAWGYRVKAENYRSQAEMERESGEWNGFGTMLGSGFDMLPKFGKKLIPGGG